MRRIFALFILILAIALGAGTYYVLDRAVPTPEALAVLAGYEGQRTEAKGYIYWRPDHPSATGVIFYQGGKVEEEAYAPLLLPLLEEGYSVFVPKMPLNLAVLNAGAAEKIIQAHPEVYTWWIGGHSLGGAMAADYVYSQPDRISGLFLLGAYPQEKKSLSASDVDVVAFFGTLDGLVGTEGIEGWMALLPPSAERVMIEGGNHAQFGNYGGQKGDLLAAIGWEDQQGQVREVLLEKMDSQTRMTFEGVIEEISENGVLVRVENFNAFDLAWVRLMPGAQVLDSKGSELGAPALKVDMRVRVTTRTEIAESYPVQVNGLRFVILGE